MKRRLALAAFAVLFALVFVIVKPIAQQPPFDKEKSRQELETMKGILRTSLSYALKRMDTKPASTGEPAVIGFGKGEWGFGGIEAFYLQGQGAVFVIPMSALRGGGHMIYGEGFEFGDVMGLEEAVIAQAALGKAMTEDMARAIEEQKESAQTPKPAEGKDKDQPTVQKKMEQNKARIEKMQQKLEQRRAEAKKQQELLLSRVQGLKGGLKDALANFGDSLTIVKPEEWVTVVISGGGGGFKMWESGDQDESCHVIAVKKSMVTDLKAGKISREEFDRRLTDYNY